MRKGIILAGGSGTRLFPMTAVVSKQLLPVYDKPMIYYPLSVLMMAGITEILIITTPHDQNAFQKLLGTGAQWGLSISFASQPSPDGLAQALIIGEAFLAGGPCAMVLGDNIFYGHGLDKLLEKANQQSQGASVFGYHVTNPQRYGVVSFDDAGRAVQIDEKPEVPGSNYAVTGLYFYDGTAPARAAQIKPSKRGELEITALNQSYLDDGELSVELMGRGYAWFDTGTFDSLLEASEFVRTLQSRQGLRICCPEEIALTRGLISGRDLMALSQDKLNNPYFAELYKLGERYAAQGQT
jgi:glucose-1-phosphate thymidylyltransferase